MMIFKLGSRNIFRNRRRTIITCLIMGLGLTALIFADAFLKGLNENMINSVTSSFIGDGQVHRKDFLKTRELEKIITQSEAVLSQLKNDSRIKEAVPRAMASAMIASPTDVLPVALYGINAIEELKISSLNDAIVKGSYLKAEEISHVLIGEKLAKFLGADVGDKVVLTTTNAKTGMLSQELFRVGGIFKMKNKEMDSSVAFINLSKAQEFMGIDNSFHEIVFKFRNRNDVLNPPVDFLKEMSVNDNEALSWKKLVPAIDAGIQLTSYSLYIGTFILFAIIALSTMNTLFMSIYERMYEFGIMKAIGTRPLFIFRMIVLEAAALAILSALLGTSLGSTITFFTNKIGISHLKDVEYLGTTIKSSIRPVFETNQYIVYPLAIFVFAILSSIYPAITAAKIDPSKSLKRE